MHSSNESKMAPLIGSFGALTVGAGGKDCLDVSQIVFSQRTVSSTFEDGRSLAQVTEQLVNQQINPDQIPPIRVVKYRGLWYALDNRRLRVFKDAFVEKIVVVKCNLDEKEISREFHQKRTNKAVEGGGVVRQAAVSPAYGRSAHFDEGSYVFTKKVLSWTFEQLQFPLRELMHTPNLPAAFSVYSPEQYYQGFLNLILEEARATLFAGLESLEKAELVELTFIKDKLSKNQDNPSLLTFQKHTPTQQAYKSGDVVVLQNRKIPELRLLGMINFLKENPNVEEKQIQVKIIMESALRSHYSDASKEWTAQLLGSVITHSRMYEVCVQMPAVDFLQQLLTGELSATQSVHSYLGLNYSPFMPQVATETISTQNSRINISQRQAIEKFLSLDRGIQLVQGPPGTGKTTMTVALLEELLRMGKRVMVCAPSNKAVQVIAERFFLNCPKAPMVFAGVEDRLPEDSPLQVVFIHTWAQQVQDDLVLLSESVWALLKQSDKLKSIEQQFLVLFQRIERYPFSFLGVLLDAKQRVLRALADLEGFFHYDPKPETSEAISRAKVYLSNLSRIFTEISTAIAKYALDDTKTGLEGQLLDCSKIIFSTLSVSGRKSFKDMNQVDVLVVDEAGQCVEAETLIPLVTKPKKCLLIGDTNQLPATILSQEAEQRGYGRSLLFRLLENCKQPYTLLDVQYRMDPAISRWPSGRYYEGKIRDDESVMGVREKTFMAQDSIPRFICPYAFVNVNGIEEQSHGKSYLNKLESEYIGWTLGYLRQQLKVDLVKRIGIITFYKGQSDYLQRQIKSRFGEIKIQTVDSFQGSENDIIIISFVRANERNQVGFLKDFRRLNVALTRAKYSLVMFGNAKTLMSGMRDLENLIGDAMRRECYYEGEAVKQIICHPSVPKPGKNPAVKQRKQDVMKTTAPVPRLSSGTKQSTKVATKSKSSAPSTKPTVAYKSKQQPCRFFTGQPNSCKKGESCTFVHTAEFRK